MHPSILIGGRSFGKTFHNNRGLSPDPQSGISFPLGNTCLTRKQGSESGISRKIPRLRFGLVFAGAGGVFAALEVVWFVPAQSFPCKRPPGQPR